MINLLKAVLRRQWARLCVMRDPVKYARSLGVKVGQNVHFYGMDLGMFGSEPWLITIGNNVHITNGVMFITHDGGTLILRNEVPDLEWTAPITIGNDVYIGYRAIILPNVSIGNRCVIGAGAVVSKSVPENSVAVGVPARVVRSVDEYRDRLSQRSLHCGHLHGKKKEMELRRILGVRP
jgi:acetyltransferase-like isoleucine patch superfamily enzyme